MSIIKTILANSPLILIVTAFAVVPPFLPNAYHVQVLVFIGIYVVLALSLNLLNGYVGLLSIGHAAFYAVGAYASAKLTLDAGLPWPAAFLGSGAIAGCAGWLIARPTLRLSGIYMTL